MKKIYSLIYACSLTLISLNTNAATITVAVGVNASFSPASVFTPSVASAVIGDTIQFILAAGTHNVTSTSVPGGAAAMSSGTMSTLGQIYKYGITVAGTYSYMCSIHGATMSGTINATAAAGITTNVVDLTTSAYPNPFKDKLTLKYNSIESIELFNIVGDKVKTFELPSTETKTEIDLSDLSAGVYFIRTYKEGTVVETKKIVKSK